MTSSEQQRPDGRVAAVGSVAVPLGRNPVTACALPAGAIDDRLTEWATVLDHAARRIELGDGIRVEFEPTVQDADMMRLVRAEQTCCNFLRFAITADERGVALEVRSEAAGVAVVRELFGDQS